jgi:hypothetical protein
MAKKNSINNKVVALDVNPTTGSDAFIQLDINDTGKFRIGIDDDDGDVFKISSGSALGSNDTFVMTSSGERTLPLQPSFGAVASDQSNVTGDGTTYTVTFSSSEYFDRGSNFDGTSTFTAPVTGKYILNADVTVSGSDGDTGYITLSTSNRDYASGIVNVAAVDTAGGYYTFRISKLVDMDASDTAVVKITVGGGTKITDIVGASTFFEGHLAC